MSLLKSAFVQCPYCGEVLELLIDDSIEEQAYIEDCQVCCRPISVFVNFEAGGEPQVEVKQEDE